MSEYDDLAPRRRFRDQPGGDLAQSLMIERRHGVIHDDSMPARQARHLGKETGDTEGALLALAEHTRFRDVTARIQSHVEEIATPLARLFEPERNMIEIERSNLGTDAVAKFGS